MEAFALDTNTGSDIYHALGLKESKGALGVPRVLSLFSSLLERSVHKNEDLLGSSKIKDVITVFHGLRAPSLSITQYMDRIFKYAGCSPSCFVVAYIYVDRYLRQTDVCLTSLNVHRLLITSVLVAAKFIDDAFFNNAYYAKVGGISRIEMNTLEVKFLFSLNFRLQVTVDTFRWYCSLLEREAPGGVQIDRRFIHACRINETLSSKDDAPCSSTTAR